MYEKQTTHEIMKYYLMMKQLAGCFPLGNVLTSDPRKLTFKWLSWRTACTLILVLFSFEEGIKYAYKQWHDNLIRNSLPLLLLMNSAFVFYDSIFMAKRWRKFVWKLSIVERKLIAEYGEPKRLKLFVHLFAMVYILIGATEHSLNAINNIFDVTRFDIKIFIHGFIGWYAWFLWTIGCLFIIHLSIIFSARFKHLTDALEEQMKMYNNGKAESYFKYGQFRNFCKRLRDNYKQLNARFQEMDEILGHSLLNLYVFSILFILLVLFNNLKYFEEAKLTFPFFLSCSFVILKLILLSTFSARTTDQTRRLAKIIYEVPENIWNEDLEKLLQNVYLEPAELTGNKFFVINRSLLLNIASTVITYEIMLIQFIERFKAKN